MAPNITSAPTNVQFEKGTSEDLHRHQVTNGETKKYPEYRIQIVWRNVIIFVLLHTAALYGLYLAITSAKLVTTIFAFFLYQASGYGITAGAHRLWAHRSYKAKWQLRTILAILNTLAFQDSAIDWARDHRMHHKYSETDADPHNATRGFFFAHVGWLLCRKHPEIKEKGKGIDLTDLYSDPILKFQKKYYLYLMPITCFVIPTVIPVYFWNETWANAYFIPTILRYTFTLNMTWLVNSAAHLIGNKPYDKFINPSENRGVAIGALGEGWHNYHHVFPWDYKTSELGNYAFNFTTAFIDFFAMIGWAYDLKTVSMDMVRKRVERTGDGTHELWGWGDKDLPREDREAAIIVNPTKDQ
ncbi:hypothetical protein QAD02_010977 [Eretmocerus hayati]|uniref:Uncharacterized protein n=1 Tax=Eretmocerus hayati TaxID=131215 RepID=A0ACC2NX59_9HYME|nr:hypothetical protein QAD02_010977 [Eretmocerus hayati]